MSSKELIPAVFYGRMSSDQQGEQSIDQQLEAVQKLAEKEGYVIIRQYVDYGKSGSKYLSKRVQFKKMIADSHNKDFQVVLVWAVNRFGRMAPFKAAQFKDTLKDNGVYLHSVTQGVIKWENMVDYIMDTIHAAYAAQYSIDLAKDCIRGRLDVLNAGNWPSGLVPYGYDKLYKDPKGESYLVRRRDKFSKGDGWTRDLVVNQDEAKVVQWIFDRYVTHDESLRFLAQSIKAPRPDGSNKEWTKDTVKAIIRQKAYCGYAHIGGFLANKTYKPEALVRFGYHEAKGNWEAIISEELWAKAQRKLGDNKRMVPKADKSSPLSGILFCGRCKYPLDKLIEVGADGEAYVYFKCSSYGRRPQLGCKQARIRESVILPRIIGELVDCIDEELLKRSEYEFETSDNQESMVALQKSLSGLRRKIEQGEENYLAAPATMREGLLRKLEAWHQEQEELERQIANSIQSQGDISGFVKQWESVRGQLVNVWAKSLPEEDIKHNDLHGPIIEYNPENGEPMYLTDGSLDLGVRTTNLLMEHSRFRAILKDMGFRAYVYWEKEGTKYYKVSKVEISTQGSRTVSSMEPAGDTPIAIRFDGTQVPSIFRVITLGTVARKAPGVSRPAPAAPRTHAHP